MMKEKVFLGKYYIFIVLCSTFIISTAGILFITYTIQERYVHQTVSVLGALSESGETIDKSIIDEVLGDNIDRHYTKGMSVLSDNGYEKSGLLLISELNYKEVLLLTILLAVALLIICVFIIFLYQNHVRFLKIMEEWLDHKNDRNYYKNVISLKSKETEVFIEKLNHCFEESNYNVNLLQREKEKIYHFMEDVSHQLKTPLALLQLYVERLLDEQKNGNKELLDFSLLQIEKMKALIRSLLKIGMLDSGKIKMEMEKNSLYDTLEEIIDDLSPMSEVKNITLLVEKQPQDSFQFDSFWMKEALANIIKNGIEHSPVNSHIRINYQMGIHEITIEISDEGAGMEEANIPHLFERFTSCCRQKDDSNGLGLSIAKKVVLGHFGNISVKNNAERGVTFTIRLPIIHNKEVYNTYKNDVNVISM